MAFVTCSKFNSLSTATESGLLSAKSSVASLSTTTSTGLSNTSSAIASLSTIVNGLPTNYPPSGEAGGDLVGSYPNPKIKQEVKNEIIADAVAQSDARDNQNLGLSNVGGQSRVSIDNGNNIGLKSMRSGNLIQVDPDGTLYYGVEAQADVRNQYVDPINGNDSNNGSRAAPLRTIVRALDRIPQNTIGNYIFLNESGTHYWQSSDLRTFNAGVTMQTYGYQTDVKQTQWSQDVNLWPWFGWTEAPQATIEFVINRNFTGQPSTVIGVQLDMTQTAIVKFEGIKLIAPAKPNNLQSRVLHWNSALVGNGIYEFVDCTLNNFNATTPLFSSATHWSFTTRLVHVNAEASSVLWALAGGGRIQNELYSRGSLTPGSWTDGKAARGTTTPANLKAKATNAQAAQAIVPNFPTTSN